MSGSIPDVLEAEEKTDATAAHLDDVDDEEYAVIPAGPGKTTW